MNRNRATQWNPTVGETAWLIDFDQHTKLPTKAATVTISKTSRRSIHIASDQTRFERKNHAETEHGFWEHKFWTLKARLGNNRLLVPIGSPRVHLALQGG